MVEQQSTTIRMGRPLQTSLVASFEVAINVGKLPAGSGRPQLVGKTLSKSQKLHSDLCCYVCIFDRW